MDASAWCVLFFLGVAALMVGGSIWHIENRKGWVDDCVIEKFEENLTAPGSLKSYCEALERRR